MSPPAAVAPLISDTVEALWAKPLSADQSRIVAGDWLMTLMRWVSVPTLVAVVPVLMALANPVEGAVIVTLFGDSQAVRRGQTDAEQTRTARQADAELLGAEQRRALLLDGTAR